MSSRIVQVALRICLIKEEFSESEIAEAVKLLEDQGSISSLLDHLLDHKPKDSMPKKKRAGYKSKPINQQRSKAVLDLQDKNPEKFHVLIEFDSLVRQGKILPELEDIKRLGEQLSKDFAPKNSRRNAISKLMSLIASRPISEIREIISRVLSSSHFENKNNEYNELARFIITGESSQTKSF